MKNIMKNILLAYCILAMLLITREYVDVKNKVQESENVRVIAARKMSLKQRYDDRFINDVFKKNILLTMSYLKGDAHVNKKIDWNKVDKPFTYHFTLKPNEVFAFHDDLLREYRGKVTKTTGVKFNSLEGFLLDGYLIGDGVCHLASLMNWVARDAGLQVVSPTNHDFAQIPEVPRKYGVSIYSTSAIQNLYIKNTLKNNVVLKFAYDGTYLKVEVAKSS